jgi:hypothetical protein
VKPLTSRYLPFRSHSPPPPPPSRAAGSRAPPPAAFSEEAFPRSARDVVAAVVVLVAAEQLALLSGPPATADLVVLRQLLLQRGPPHLALVPVLGQLALLRRRRELEVRHPRPPGRLLSGPGAGAGAVPQLGRARHRGHIPIRRQHLRHHPLPAAQVGNGDLGGGCADLFA